MRTSAAPTRIAPRGPYQERPGSEPLCGCHDASASAMSRRPSTTHPLTQTCIPASAAVRRMRGSSTTSAAPSARATPSAAAADARRRDADREHDGGRDAVEPREVDRARAREVEQGVEMSTEGRGHLEQRQRLPLVGVRREPAVELAGLVEVPEVPRGAERESAAAPATSTPHRRRGAPTAATSTRSGSARIAVGLAVRARPSERASSTRSARVDPRAAYAAVARNAATTRSLYAVNACTATTGSVGDEKRAEQRLARARPTRRAMPYVARQQVASATSCGAAAQRSPPESTIVARIPISAPGGFPSSRGSLAPAMYPTPCSWRQSAARGR